MEQLLKQLFKTCSNTKQARFESSRRMDRCNQYSNFCIAFLSLEIVAINLFQLKVPQDDFSQTVSIVTILLSVFALVLSLMVNQAQYAVKSKIYHSCSISLDDLCYEINVQLHSGTQVTAEKFIELKNKYMSIINQANLNHSQLDYQWAVRKSDEVKEHYGYSHNEMVYWWHRLCLWLQWYVFCISSIYLLIAIIGALLVYQFVISSVDFPGLWNGSINDMGSQI